MKTIVKTILSLAIFTAFLPKSNAQNLISKSNNSFSLEKTSIGVRGGVNFSTMTQFPLLQSITPDFQFLPSPSGAIFAEIPISNHLSIQPELAFTQKGFFVNEYANVGGNFLGIDLPIGGSLAFKTNYVELPILAKINLGNPQETHIYLLAGPAIGYLFDSRAMIDILGIFPISTNIGTGLFNKIDFSGIASAGVSVPMGRSTFFVEGRYQYGFSRVLDTGFVLLPIRNRTLGASIGFQIPIGR
jgi:Outer membrane protein beta-barrel domain